MQKGKELNDFQRNPLDIEILSNLRFGSLEIRDTSITRVTNNSLLHSTRISPVELLVVDAGPGAAFSLEERGCDVAMHVFLHLLQQRVQKGKELNDFLRMQITACIQRQLYHTCVDIDGMA